jgi:dTDP-4-dehydrorhamnose reductase
MRVLVTGAGGMLGRDLVDVLTDVEVTAVTRAELDITDATAVSAVVPGHHVVVNAAAWTDVDGAEEHEAEAVSVNGLGPQLLSAACATEGARLIHVSTDYVFDGAATAPYPEDAVLAPRSAYGRSKAAGELAVRALLPNAGYVVRTAWLYGEHGANFVTTMLRLEQSHETVQVVRDQRGQPTWSRDVALRLATMVKQDLIPGTYHATSSGATTWFDVARAVFAAVGADPERVQPTTTANFPRPAPRPAYSVLGHDAWRTVGLAPLRDWQVALEEAVPLLRAAVEAA